MQYNCPICDKAGLPNYKATETICPQCNSDLKPFLLLRSVKTKNNSSYKYLSGGLALSVILLLWLYMAAISDSKYTEAGYIIKTKELKDSIVRMNEKKSRSEADQIQSSTSEKMTIHYKVKHGDNLSKIAYFFYNDWRMYKKIETDNNIKPPYTLSVGQSLLIKLNP